ncbi:HalOD1 output domain-containing protein [Halostagnicola bangensis]
MSTTTDNLVVDIVRTLEEHGLPRDEYQLGTEFDPEALERLVQSGDQSIEVRLEVQGIPLIVTPDGIRVRRDE